MNFALKIVRGANEGAEIALPEGVSVSLGKGDDCDIVLADATLPDEALTLEASSNGVTLNGEPLEPSVVVERGATSFAIGPADAPWGELKWPEREEKPAGPAVERSDKEEEGEVVAQPSSRQTNKRYGCFGCLLMLILLLIALGVVVWIFRERAVPYVERVVRVIHGRSHETPVDAGANGEAHVSSVDDVLSALVERYGLELTNRAERVTLVGDFATRAERLSATAEAYAAQPGVELDFCDDESLRSAAADTLALVGEKGMRIGVVTNRVLVLSGTAANLRRILEAFAADIPKLRNVDCSGVRIGNVVEQGATDVVESDGNVSAHVRNAPRLVSRKAVHERSLPVCGIMTTPYPCLVLKNGTRVTEGAPFGDSVILKIEADMVTLTNSTGRFTWKP